MIKYPLYSTLNSHSKVLYNPINLNKCELALTKPYINGDKWIDFSIFGNDGIIHGAVKDSDGFLSFNGTTDYIYSPCIPSDIGTLELVFKPKSMWDDSGADNQLYSATSGRNIIVQNWASPTPPTGENVGAIDFVITPSGGCYSDLETKQKIWYSDKWYDLVVTWGNGYQKIYINGILDNYIEQTETGGWGEGIYIGGDTNSNYSAITLAKVCILSRVKSPLEILQSTFYPY